MAGAVKADVAGGGQQMRPMRAGDEQRVGRRKPSEGELARGGAGLGAGGVA
ncbi:hypothetical protein [Paractinoplanes hotanensis]|uniref:hypothetical protein n=1 Tax=Paractinoplanes hotanensis TaxID=2906497 RepID=UPI0020447E13|nr:hypothetical protein [Actinoplanes hotanensis]